MNTNKTQPSCALVRYSSDNAPSKVGIGEERLAKLRENYDESHKRIGRDLIGDNAIWGLKYAGLPGAIALLSLVNPATPAIVGLPLVLAAVAGAVGSMVFLVGSPLFTYLTQENAQALADRTHDSLREAFHREQKAAFEARQTALVTLADTELVRDRLLDERTLSYLAAVRPEFLQKVHDERLAISVLQARALLAWHRCNQKHEDGEKLVKKPLSCATLRLDPSDPLHRTMLREKLERADPVLEEDNYPDHEELPIQPPQLRLGFWGHVGRYFANPLFTASDKRRYMADLPEVEPIDVKPLIAAEDFAAALKYYEKETPPARSPCLTRLATKTPDAGRPPERFPPGLTAVTAQKL